MSKPWQKGNEDGGSSRVVAGEPEITRERDREKSAMTKKMKMSDQSNKETRKH